MQPTKFIAASCAWAAAITLGLLTPYLAQADEAQTRHIIESLKPDTTPRMRTRSLRNLQVEQAGNEATSAAKFVSLTIGFQFNSAEISPESGETLNSLAKALKSEQLAELEFMVEGHTDGKGTPEYNLKLSQQRAAAVKNYLEKLGIASKRLRSQGKGDTELANAQDRFAAENRRVKIITLTH